MKIFIRGILTMILVFTFTLIPTIIFTQQVVNDDLVGEYTKEELTKQIIETVKVQIPELDQEKLDALKESLDQNEKTQKIISKYSDKIIKDLSRENIDNINLESDIKTIIKENQNEFKEILNTDISDEIIDQALKEVNQNELNTSYQQIIKEAKQDMQPEVKIAIDSYNNVTSNEFIIILTIISIISLIVIALLKNPHYKFVGNLAIALLIAACFIAIIAGSMGLIFNIIVDTLNQTNSISITPMLLTSGIMLILGIILLVLQTKFTRKEITKEAIN